MQLELWSNGTCTRIAIDGNSYIGYPWSCDVTPDGMGLTTQLLTGAPIKIGKHTIKGLTFDKPHNAVMNEYTDPTKVTLLIVDNGVDKQIKMNVIRTANEQFITNVRGETEKIDEITYYIHASDENHDMPYRDPLDEVGDWVIIIQCNGMRKADAVRIAEEGDLTDYEITKV